ncbi:MAG TPA: hypothetical protein PKI27_00855 [Dermatophilaceae bacterium]|mgnify:FL=1|nr:hypothetical protein [Dermatophilaceae bacterium]
MIDDKEQDMTTTTGTTTKQQGVDLSCVDEAVLADYCGRYGVDVTGKTTAERVTALAAKIRATVPKNKIADCDNCHGDSCVDDEVCPYCGVGGFDGPTPAPKPTPAAAPAPAPAPATPKKRSEATPAPAPAPKTKGNGAAGPAIPAPEATAAAPAPKPKAGKSKTQAAAAKAAALAAATNAAPAPEPAPAPELPPAAPPVVVAPATELVPNGATTTVDGRTVYDLVEVQARQIAKPDITIDEAVSAVHEAKRLAVVCYWRLGQAVLRCFADDLWKQRRDDKDQPVYRGFVQFCEAELGMAASYAYKLMNVAATFSASDVARIGVAKLGLMLRLDPSTREKLLAEVRNGVPYSDVAERVRLLAEGTPPQKGQGKKDTSKATNAASIKARESAGEIITATFETKRLKMPLFARPAANKAGEAKRAKRLADDPWGEIVALNGVVMRFAVTTDSEGRLLAIVECRRPTTEATKAKK